MINIMLKNVDWNNKWWIELIKTINYFRNRSSMINKSIISFEIDTRRKFFFVHLRRIKITSYVMKRKSITKWKIFALRLFFVVFVNYEKDHLYRMLRFNEIIYRVSSIIWTKKKRKKLFLFISETSIKRSIIESIILSQAAIQKQNCVKITWCDYDHVTWQKWLDVKTKWIEVDSINLNIYRRSDSS